MKISFSESALSDLDGINKYYSDHGVQDNGEGFVIDIFGHVETLSAHPDIGRIVPEFNEEHIRELIHPPFRIVYLRGKKSVVVIRVFRSDRELRLEDD